MKDNHRDGREDVQKEARDDSDALERQLVAGLAKLDEWYPVEEPVLTELERLVVMERYAQRSRLRREWILFAAAAVMIVALSLIGLMQMPVVYLLCQALFLLAFPLGLAIRRRKRGEVR